MIYMYIYIYIYYSKPTLDIHMITNSFTVLLRNDLLTILHALVLIGRWCFEHSLSDCVIVCEFYY